MSLENVSTYGTEGRKGNASEEIPANDSIYDYIVFRGSDVKDLRIEEKPKESTPAAPQMPNDPAILGVSPAVSLPQDWMMKYSGCKIFNIIRERKNHVDIFRCLPSDVSKPSILAAHWLE